MYYLTLTIMCDYAKCKQCQAIYEKKKINQILGRYSKGLLGKESLCVDCIKKEELKKAERAPQYFGTLIPQTERHNS